MLEGRAVKTTTALTKDAWLLVEGPPAPSRLDLSKAVESNYAPWLHDALRISPSRHMDSGGRPLQSEEFQTIVLACMFLDS